VKHRRVLGVAAALLAIAGVAGCSNTESAGETGFIAGDGSLTLLDPSVREPAPEVGGELLEGGSWSLADELGNVVVLNVWASWCAPCRAEAPVLEEVWREYQDQNVSFIGLNTRDSGAAALAFIDTYGITYPNLIDTDGRQQLQFAKTLPPQAIPSTVVIDAHGRVAGRALGVVSASSLRGLIDPLLESP
jgi:thiol-disulfide isomerase/thioredoxin